MKQKLKTKLSVFSDAEVKDKFVTGIDFRALTILKCFKCKLSTHVGYL